MKKILQILRNLLGFFALFTIISYTINYFRAPKLESNEVPTINTTLVDGSSFSTIDAKSKPLMIHFWGTWCPICKQEAGNIASVSQRYNVITIAVNSGSNSNIKEWLKKEGVSYPVINDTDGSLAKKFNVTVYPTSFIYDSNGNLSFTETGYTTTAGLFARMRLAQ